MKELACKLIEVMLFLTIVGIKEALTEVTLRITIDSQHFVSSRPAVSQTERGARFPHTAFEIIYGNDIRH